MCRDVLFCVSNNNLNRDEGWEIILIIESWLSAVQTVFSNFDILIYRCLLVANDFHYEIGIECSTFDF